MGHTLLRSGSSDVPLIVSSLERGLRFNLGKIEGAGARPNIIEQAAGSNLYAFVVEDGQLPARQFAPGRAFDADLEPETAARRYGGR